MIFRVFILIALAVVTTAKHHEKRRAVDGDLVFSHVIYRHGARTPIEPYPNDPWKDPKFWAIGWGQLTNVSISSTFWIFQIDRHNSVMHHFFYQTFKIL